MKARVETKSVNGQKVTGKQVIKSHGPVQYSGPEFWNQWPIPEGSKHVIIRVMNSRLGTFLVEFTK